MGRSHQISDWDPEDSVAWEAGNKFIARRNLIWSVAAEHVGFSVWSLWSVMVLFMPTSVYGFSAGDKFLLGATATLVGACLRFPYTFATAKFGGRNWTIFSALVLLIPTVGSILLLANPGLPLWPYLVCGALAGLGGGNFAASMTNINAFFPQRLKGAALALNAGGGNLGVPMVQLVGLLVIATAGDREPYWVCAIYLVLLAVAGLGAALYMDNLTEYRIELNTMRAVVSEPHTWVISLLYILVGDLNSAAQARKAVGTGVRKKTPEPDSAEAPAAAAAPEEQVQPQRRRRPKIKQLGRGYEYLDLDPETGHDPTGSPQGAGTLGFAGTTHKASPGQVAGLITLPNDAFGGSPRTPMMPGTWDTDSATRVE